MSFVQFNLLPDVKLEYNRAQKAKKIAHLVSGLAAGIALTAFILSFLAVDVLQKKLLSDANNDITNYSQKLKSIPDLDKILTIQNQLNSLPGLHQQKHYTSRLFVYLPQITPINLNIGKLTLDTTANSISISGTADTVETVNKFVDTLKFTSYTIGDDQTTKKLSFSNVILSKVDRNEKNASYTVDASYDPNLFASDNNIKLIVPLQITTRSVINTPSTGQPLFNGQTGPKNDQQGAQ